MADTAPTYQPPTTQPTAPIPPTPGAPTPSGSPNAPGPKRKNTWVWVLIIGVIVLAAAGVIVASCAAHHVATHLYNTMPQKSQGEAGGGSSGQNPNGALGGTDPMPNSGMQGLTFDEIVSTTGVAAGSLDGSEYGTGVYRVGTDGLTPGLYYLGGSQTTQGSYYLFDGDDDAPDHYDLEDSIIYFGNYFVNLEAGDAIVYQPGGDEKMHAQGPEALGVSAPYQSGVYRVGVDIPAGTYTITVERQCLETATGESGAFVMKDLDFDDGSILNTVYVRVGGRQTITVSDGQYLELYAAEANPGGEATPNADQSQGQTDQGQSGSGGSGSSGATDLYYYHHPEEHHAT